MKKTRNIAIIFAILVALILIIYSENQRTKRERSTAETDYKMAKNLESQYQYLEALKSYIDLKDNPYLDKEEIGRNIETTRKALVTTIKGDITNKKFDTATQRLTDLLDIFPGEWDLQCIQFLLILDKILFNSEKSKTETVISNLESYLKSNPPDDLKIKAKTALKKFIAKKKEEEAKALKEMSKRISKGPNNKKRKTINKSSKYPPCDSFDYCINMGFSASQQKNYDRAIYYYTRAINEWKNSDALEGDLAACHFDRGNAYFYKRKYANAIKDYNKTIELQPLYAPAYGMRGLAYYRSGKSNKAIYDLKKAADLGLTSARDALKLYFNIDY